MTLTELEAAVPALKEYTKNMPRNIFYRSCCCLLKNVVYFSSFCDIIITETIIQIKEESRLNRIIGKKAPDFHLKAVSAVL